MVAHAGRVVLEVAQGALELVFLDAFEGVGAGGPAEAIDVPVVEVLEPGGEPFVLMSLREPAVWQTPDVVAAGR